MVGRLLSRLRIFRDDASGSVTVEFVLAMPILFWSFMAAYTFFDGYRQSALNLKAAYTVSDLISRETQAINDAYVDSMVRVLRLMTDGRSDTALRISVIRWDESESAYFLDWSANRGFAETLTDETLRTLEDQLPTMPDNERVILVETENRFVPMFEVGLGDTLLSNFVFTRPRFVAQVPWENSDDGVVTDLADD